MVPFNIRREQNQMKRKRKLDRQMNNNSTNNRQIPWSRPPAIGGSYPTQANNDRQAINELKEQITIMRQEISMLMNQFHPICGIS